MSGLSIVVMNSDAVSRNQYIINGVAAAFRSAENVQSCVVSTYRTLVSDVKRVRADLLVVIGGSGGYTDIIRSALRYVDYSIFWATEDPYELLNNVEFSRIFKVTYTNEEGSISAYQGRAKFLPLAADRSVHYRPLLLPQESLFDLFFVGTAWPDRVETLNKIVRALPSTYRLKIGLSGNQYLPDFTLGDLNNITSFRLSPREFAGMANRAAVTLTLDRSFSLGDKSSGLATKAKTPPPRLFEIAAAGSSQVYLSKRNASEKYFGDGAIAEVDSAAKAAEAIVTLVENDAARVRLSRKAQQKVLAEHLYQNRVAVLLNDYATWGEARSKASGDAPVTGSPRNSADGERRRVLCVTHNAMGRHPFGGVEIYQQNVLATLPGFDFFFLFPDRTIQRLVLTDGAGEMVRVFEAGLLGEFVVQDRLREHILHQVIDEYAIDIVHYHHLLGHPLSLPLHSHAAGVPSVLQMHDYFMICREFNLVGLSDRYCHIRDPDTSICNICLSSRGVVPPGAQARRRHAVTTALEHVDVIFHSSTFSLDKLGQIYPGIERDKSRVVGLAIAEDQLAALLAVRTTSPVDEKLRICILGNFTRNKGSEFLTQMFWELRKGPYLIRILGRVDDTALAHHISATFPNVEVLGTYTPEMLPALLSHTDVSIHFSIWPETYCLSVDEAWAAGVVPIVLGYGALGERVEHRRTGFVIDPSRPYDLVPLIKEIAANKEMLREMVPDASILRDMVAAHRKQIAQHYDALIGADPAKVSAMSGSRARLGTEELDVRFCSADWASEAIVIDKIDEDYLPRDTIATEMSVSHVVQARQGGAAPGDVDAFLHPGDHEIYLTVGGEKVQVTADIALLLPTSLDVIDVTLTCAKNLSCALHLLEKGEVRRLEPAATREQERHRDQIYRFSRLGAEADNCFFLLTIDGNVCRRYIAGPYIAGHARKPREYQQMLSHNVIAESLVETVPTFFDRRLRHAQTFLNARKAPMRIHLDSCNDAPVETQTRFRIARHAQTMRIRGWAVPKARGSFDRIGFRLVGKDYAVEGLCALERREDLVPALGRADALWSGFTLEIPIAKLHSGVYSLFINGIANDGRTSFSSPIVVSFD